MKKIGIVLLLIMLILGIVSNWACASDAQRDEPLRANHIDIRFSLSGNIASGRAIITSPSDCTIYTVLTLQYLDDSGSWRYYASNTGYGLQVSITSSIVSGTYRLKAVSSFYDNDGNSVGTYSAFSSQQKY